MSRSAAITASPIARRRDLLLARLLQLALDAVDDLLELLDRHRAAWCRPCCRPLRIFSAVERLAPAVLLDHQRQDLVDALVGREAPPAARALAAAADDLCRCRTDGCRRPCLRSGSRTGNAWRGLSGVCFAYTHERATTYGQRRAAQAPTPAPPWRPCWRRWASTRRASPSNATATSSRARPGPRRRWPTATRSRSSPSLVAARAAARAAARRPADADDDPLVLGGRKFNSRLLIGTGKYRTLEEGREAILRSGAEIVTVALRRVDLTPGQAQRPRHHRSHAPHASSPTPPAATPPRRRSAPAAWRASWASPTW